MNATLHPIIGISHPDQWKLLLQKYFQWSQNHVLISVFPLFSALIIRPLSPNIHILLEVSYAKNLESIIGSMGWTLLFHSTNFLCPKMKK